MTPTLIEAAEAMLALLDDPDLPIQTAIDSRNDLRSALAAAKDTRARPNGYCSSCERLSAGICVEDGCGKPLYTAGGTLMQWCKGHVHAELLKVLPGMVADAYRESADD